MTCHSAWTHITRGKYSGRVTKSSEMAWSDLACTVEATVTCVHAKSFHMSDCHCAECSPSGSSLPMKFSRQEVRGHMLSSKGSFHSGIEPTSLVWQAGFLLAGIPGEHSSNLLTYPWGTILIVLCTLMHGILTSLWGSYSFCFLVRKQTKTQRNFKICSRSPIKRR